MHAGLALTVIGLHLTVHCLLVPCRLMGKVADRSSDQDHKGVSGSWLQQQRQKEALS